MPLLIIGSLVLVAFLAVWLGFVPPPYAGTLIQIHGGRLLVKRGKLRPLARDQIGEILQEAGVTHGFIAVTSETRITFSRRIPPSIHQRLRNVLLNQWA